ncbi:hypothetical protein AMAG_04184 [Allomyces macrogynus ATCC 38327]|uniref:GST N-terminal domain-containing protein n=1 Tax=Allomyces macrogynus (strain ATCC 38327) TaxID=578462 RepID=A0A0L0S869_ALLM3|nr:hypothetical protein AMAG_04184 [Allomyces macrogynus ATCC 38327]|eukprot:KNE58621.1 hypothetical protein AMAG_04184 [Allomyces macrogynus ATCC 38327]
MSSTAVARTAVTAAMATKKPAVKLVGSDMSPYVHKLRQYFKYRNIAFEDVLATPKIYETLILPKTHLTMIPVVVEDGSDRVLQDTGLIIDHFEAKLASSQAGLVPLDPPGPKQKLVANLLEFVSEEWMFLVGFAERFGHFENGHELHLLREMAASRSVKTTGLAVHDQAVRQRLDAVFLKARRPWGVTEETMPMFDRFLEWYLVKLATHFDNHTYLFSDEIPCRADFSLAGMLAGFIDRDPKPSFMLRTKAPTLLHYIDRMNQQGRAGYKQPEAVVAMDGTAPGPVRITRAPARTGSGSFFANDEVPDTLYPLLEPLFTLVPHIEQGYALAAKLQGTPGPLPRRLGFAKFTIHGEPAGSRMAQSYALFAFWRIWRNGAQFDRSVLAKIAERADPTQRVDGDAFVRRVAELKEKVQVRRTAKNEIELMSPTANGTAQAKL